MEDKRWMLFALLGLVALVNGGTSDPGGCKNCIKNKNGHQNQRLIASPINLLNPDRYEFFTLDDKGQVVKRIMTFKEIQSIVAGSDVGGLKLMANGINNDRIMSSVVSNVRNVLNNELNSMHSQDSSHPHPAAELPISEMINEPDEPTGSSEDYSSNSKSTEEVSTEVVTEKATVQTTEQVMVESTESTTKRLPSKATTRPTEIVPMQSTAQSERTTERTTIRSTTSSTERASAVPSTLRPEVSSTICTKIPSTTKLPVRSTTEESKVRTTSPVPAATEKPTTRTTTMSTVSVTEERSTTQRTTVQSVDLSTDRRSTTTTTTVGPSEEPLLKPVEKPTTTVKPTEKPKITESSTTTTTGRPTESPTVATVSKVPVVAISNETSSEQSADYSTGSSMEYSTEESSEKVDQSSEAATRFTEVKTSVGSTAEFITPMSVSGTTSSSGETTKPSIVKTKESTTVATTVAPKPSSSSSAPVLVKEKIESSSTKITEPPAQVAFDVLKDLVSMVMDDDSDESSEEKTSTPASIALSKDAVAQYVTNGQQVGPIAVPVKTTSASDSKPTSFVDTPEVTTLKAIALDETIPTTALLEVDVSTMEDTTGYGSDESSEMQPTTDGLFELESTVTASDVTYKPLQTDEMDLSIGTTLQDSSTIPSDAQHAIHKIIESLQSINDSDGESNEPEPELIEDDTFPMDVPGLNYDTDAQSSINAIIQSLGQGSLASGENVLLPVTTEVLTTMEPVLTTTTPRSTSVRPSSTTTPRASSTTTSTTPTTIRTSSPVALTTTTTKQPLKSSATDAAANDATSAASGVNHNTDIMETIEKFLSQFANLPNEESYSMNLTKFNILSEYPAEINMTDYVDRTATVASVLKFPQTKPSYSETDDGSKGQLMQREDPPPQQSLTAQSLLNETVASFMKLGEMLTIGSNRVSTVQPPERVPMEVKTADDEEETELLRFLTMCGTLGTKMYDFLTGPAVEESLAGRSLVYSPFATITTLSMLFLGTRGTTAESINGVIGLDEMTSFNPHLFFKSIADDLKPKQRHTSTSSANDQHGSLFSRTLLSDRTRGGLQRFFKARIQEIYSAIVDTVDFQQKDTLLKHMSGDFPRDYVDTLKRLSSPLLSISRNRYRHECNDVTSYGFMNFKQDPTLTSGIITVPSVTFRSGFSTGFSRALDATILSLPGVTSNVSVFFLKPSTPDGLTALESHIRTQSVAAVLKLFPDETVRTAYAEVELPHFTQTTMYNMSRSIQQLGLQNLFQPNVANFNGLQDSAMSNLYLSEIVQTDSFALCSSQEVIGRILPFRSFTSNFFKHTPVAPSDKLVRRNRRKLFFHNRALAAEPQAQESKLMFDVPFLYLVRHNPTGLVLYMGRFVGNNSGK